MEQPKAQSSPWLWIVFIVVVVGATAFFTYNYFSNKVATNTDTVSTIPAVKTETTAETIKNVSTDLNNISSDLENIDVELEEIDNIDDTEDTAPTL